MSGVQHSARRLLMVGGAERRSGPGSVILERFVALAGGPRGSIAVIAAASREPRAVEAEYVEAFTRLGIPAEAVVVDNRHQANSDEATAAVARATGVFLTGGDQLRIAAIVGGSRVDSLMHARVNAGEAVLGGSSAGAAVMSSTMIVEGEDRAVRTHPGLGFLPGVVLDMHFAERGRLHRLLSAVARYPHELGLGIDEDTAVLADSGRFEVLGSGAVTMVDAGQAELAGAPAEQAGQAALTGVLVHLLPSGYTFELAGRSPVVAQARGKPDGDRQ